MNLRNTLVAAGLLAFPALAAAQPVDGLYVGAGAGYNTLGNQDIKSVTNDVTGASSSFNGLRIHNLSGYVIPVSVGYGFGNGFRVELEGSYRRTGTHLSGGTTVATSDGHNQTFGAMVNALYDFDIGMPMVFPYLGAGVGYQWTKLESTRGIIGGGGGALSIGDDRKGSVAAQGIAGLAFPIAAVPGLSATAEFRYMRVFDEEKYGGGTLSGAPVTVKVAAQNNYSGLVGLRYAFNVAPPPPPPAPAPVAAPAPAPARTYLVFFDWDKADLTDRARQIIAEAAANSSKVQLTRIECNGYTDTSGTKAYNQKLSIRRAQNVASELVKDGVPQNEITVQGFGDTHLLVPTGPGVREPQNRRVEIIFR